MNRLRGFRTGRQNRGVSLVTLGLSILVVANSLSNYLFLSRRVLVDQIRTELSAQVSSWARTLQTGSYEDGRELDRLLEAFRKESSVRIVRLQLRDEDGAVIAQAGSDVEGPSSTGQNQIKLSSRTRQAARGILVVETFSIRLPAPAVRGPFHLASRQTTSNRPSGVRPIEVRPGVMEIAAFLDTSGATLRPLKRGLLINTSLALALLFVVAVTCSRRQSGPRGRL